MPNKICILGCGWLGLPLAKTLSENGYSIKGSTTSESKADILRKYEIEPFTVILSETEIRGHIAEFLADAETLIIDVPPKTNTGESFTDKIQILIPHIEGAKIKSVIFISSTSVFADDNSVVTQITMPEPGTESGRQLLASERLLQGNTNFNTTIIRFGGLVGEDRHPVRSLSGKRDIGNPEAPINLIHRDDCIGIILAAIQHREPLTINAVAPYHPGRKVYYVARAQQEGLPEPHFSDGPSVGKTINSNVSELLQYNFIHEQP